MYKSPQIVGENVTKRVITKWPEFAKMQKNGLKVALK